MASEKIRISGFEIPLYSLNTLIIGSGAASLNAAVRLHSMGVTSIAIATTELGAGTSGNAGSDKQTYYKLSLSGNEPDSATDMARDLFNGHCMHGDIALCEAQGSVQAFMHLVELGVKFPHDKYGAYAGYKTDHDPRSRATSAGPYTSRRMFEALASEVRRLNIRVLDHHHCIALLTDSKGGKVCGAIAVNTDEPDYRRAFVLFNAVNVVIGTGGPAGIYETSVYPESQKGSTGMAFLAGATGQNLGESQFGIASVGFRWNLSGSYQQAIPRYISREKNGGDEKEFLNGHFPDMRTLTKAIFLKGYQWPFDPRKVGNHGSSEIDVLVDNEINRKNREVFLDFTRNPSGMNGDCFNLENLDPVVYDYLKNCDALKSSPIDRLLAINAPAYSLYRDHGIDLQNECLRIAVCAQHNNGGLKGDIWWQSDLRHLFPVGEVNGSHGVYRPGGSALNSGQVGSSRAALYISMKCNGSPMTSGDFIVETGETLNKIILQAESWMNSGNPPDTGKYFSEIRKRMSSVAGIFRSRYETDEAALLANEMLTALPGRIAARDVPGLVDCFLLMDHCLTHFIYLKSIHYYISQGGRSRGSYMIISDDKAGSDSTGLCTFDRKIENELIEATYRNGVLELRTVAPREIPEQDLWFEKVWKDYLEDICAEG